MLKMAFSIPKISCKWYCSTPVGNAAYKLQFKIGDKENKIYYAEGIGSGYIGQMMLIKRCVTALINEERIELKYTHALESRKYAERLIQEAIIKGPDCPFNIELMQFWLQDSRLIEKMFKELVPRYRKSNLSYTRIFKLPIPKGGYKKFPDYNAVLELRNNSFPKILTRYEAMKKIDKSQLLTNILVSAMKEEWKSNKNNP